MQNDRLLLFSYVNLVQLTVSCPGFFQRGSKRLGVGAALRPPVGPEQSPDGGSGGFAPEASRDGGGG